MAIDPKDVGQIGAIVRKLKPFRRDSVINESMWEIADDLRIMGEEMLRGRYPSNRMAKEMANDIEKGRGLFGKSIQENPDFVAIVEIGGRLIAEGLAYVPPPEGYLGINDILPDVFGFLATEFGMHRVPDDVNLAVYESAAVRLVLGWPMPNDAHVDIFERSAPDATYYLEDLLWRAGQRQHFLTWPDRPTTSDQARAWFETVATMLKTYAGDVLADAPGAFRSLAAAAAEHWAAYDAECLRLYIEHHGHPPPP